jgi:hypothetical protein
VAYSLSADCFKDLVMTHMRIGRAARAYFRFCEKALGTGIINERKRALADDPDAARSKRRLETCATVKEMMEAVSSSSAAYSGRDYATLNGMTNKAVTGKTKGEWAREWGKRSSSVNLRDHMTETALGAADFLQTCTTEALRSNPDVDAKEVHRRNCELLAAMRTTVDDQRLVSADKRTLKDARAAAQPPRAITNATTNNNHNHNTASGGSTSAGMVNTINNYFGVKPVVVAQAVEAQPE